MGMSFDDFKQLTEYEKPGPTVGDWLNTKDDFHYQMITDPKEKSPYYKSVNYDACSVQFELHFQEEFKSYTHNYLLSWSADGQKYSLNFAISTHVLANALDSMQVADLMINAYGTEMEKAGRPSGEIKCMVDFIKKIANTGKQSHYSSPTYQYMEIDDWQYKNHYATGGYVMSSKGIKGPGFEIGAGDFYADEYGNISGGGGGWQVAGYTTDGGNYRQPEVDILPGVNEVVKHPVTGDKRTIEYIIINLNDSHMWTRDQIADWLETLDVDLTFKEAPAKVDKRVKFAPDDEAIKFANLDEPGYYKGEKIEYKPTNVTQITPDTLSIQFDASKIDTKTLELMYGGAISKEEFLKGNGGNNA